MGQGTGRESHGEQEVECWTTEDGTRGGNSIPRGQKCNWRHGGQVLIASYR